MLFSSVLQWQCRSGQLQSLAKLTVANSQLLQLPFIFKPLTRVHADVFIGGYAHTHTHTRVYVSICIPREAAAQGTNNLCRALLHLD